MSIRTEYLFIAGVLVSLMFGNSQTRAQSSGLTGTVSLQPPNSTSADGQVKEVVATGIGADADGAEKQALIAAVQQAVGSYLDAKTVTENEQIIKDRILSLSNGFVSKYDVISGPKQRDDKLFEITIKAQVQGGQVVAKLKEVNLINGEVAGQNIYAQNLTQMLSAEDACKMFNEKLPELYVNCIKMEFVDKDGNPRPDSNPVDQVRDDQAQKVKCTWYIKLSVNKKLYSEQMFPLAKRCLDAMLAVQPDRFQSQGQSMEVHNGSPSLLRGQPNLHFKTNFNDQVRNYTIALIESVSRNGDSIDGLHYSGSKYKITRSKFHQYNDNQGFGSCSFTLKTGTGEIVSKSIITIGGHDFHHQQDWDLLNPFMDLETYFPMISPFVLAQRQYGSIQARSSFVAPITVEIQMNDFKDISKVDVQILPPSYDFILKENTNRN